MATTQGTQTPTVSADKPKIFISYSREDLGFADQLVIALELAGFLPTIDRHGISGGEDWKERLNNLIAGADTVVFVLSPDSATSQICDWEARKAVLLGKRIIPVVCRPLDGSTPPTVLSELNYIYFYSEPKFPGSGFGEGLRQLVVSLNTDLAWHREYTRILLRATEWDAGGRKPARLLFDADIQAAREWVARRPITASVPTELQLAYIRESEAEADALRKAEDRRLAEIAAAQQERTIALSQAEEALKQKTRVQRLRNLLLGLLAIVTTLAAIVWYLQSRTISQANRELEKQVRAAEAAAARARTAETQARSEQKRAQSAEFNSIINECETSRILLRANPGTADHLDNYESSMIRLGFALIREKRPAEAKKLFDQLRGTEGGQPAIDPVRPFYALLASQGMAIAEATATAPKTAARADAMSRLVSAASNLMQFEPPVVLLERWRNQLEPRWREEVLRGLLYVSNLAKEDGQNEIAFGYAVKLADRLSAIPGSTPEPVRLLVRALDHLSWSALLAKRPGEALAASERAQALANEHRISDLASVRLNRAHALLFNDRAEEARKLYQEIDPDIVARDVAELIAAGLCHPIFNELFGSVGYCPTP